MVYACSVKNVGPVKALNINFLKDTTVNSKGCLFLQESNQTVVAVENLDICLTKLHMLHLAAFDFLSVFQCSFLAYPKMGRVMGGGETGAGEGCFVMIGWPVSVLGCLEISCNAAAIHLTLDSTVAIVNKGLKLVYEMHFPFSPFHRTILLTFLPPSGAQLFLNPHMKSHSTNQFAVLQDPQ